MEALAGRHPLEEKKVSVTGAGYLQEWFSYAVTRGVDGHLREYKGKLVCH